MKSARGAAVALLVGTGLATASYAGSLTSLVPANPFAYIPPQCWTKTRDLEGGVHNPCYTCHVAAKEPNYVHDEDLQLAYSFADSAAVNPWTNLFEDRRADIAAITDEAVLDYVRTGNYRDASGNAPLVDRLKALPREWDVDGDGKWAGYVPDVRFDFDADGYDRDPAGNRTGWRAFAYRPLPGAFWPTNGSADDVAIRLPAAFRERADGTPDDAIYGINLAILESLITEKDVPLPPTDERVLGVDLDRDGTLGIATKVVFAFDPRNGINMSWVGRARDEQAAGRLHLAALLFPEGTEFVHSVRYLDVATDGTVHAAPRLKELRYMKKTGWRSYTTLLQEAQRETKEAAGNPDEPERFFGDVERGISNGKGWKLQGFIEAADGSLRPQTYEESLTCVGCHGAIGRNTDSVVSFPRKLPATTIAGTWYHWNPSETVGMLADDGSYAEYLRRNLAADEFRANTEAFGRFLDGDGALDPAKMATLATSVARLTDPSPERALALNKAYWLIVQDQSFTKGRLPVLHPLDATVHREVEPETPTGIEEPVRAY
ncbi:MAG: hypothetical protein U1E45_21715 [Geminicoccaceae bacterium]